MKEFKVENVTYRYKNQLNGDVLKDINYTFRGGTFYAICGESGSGKTTFLSLLAGLDEPNFGKISLDGKDIKEEGYPHHRKKNISLIFQQYNLIDYLTPLENLQLVDAKASVESLKSLGLDETLAHKNVLQLSGGQQQRVAIGRALVADTPILLGDEPTGNLDEKTGQEIIDILKKTAHKDGKCVIVVTHSKQLAENADVVLTIKNQRLTVEKN